MFAPVAKPTTLRTILVVQGLEFLAKINEWQKLTNNEWQNYFGIFGQHQISTIDIGSCRVKFVAK